MLVDRDFIYLSACLVVYLLDVCLDRAILWVDAILQVIDAFLLVDYLLG